MWIAGGDAAERYARALLSKYVVDGMDRVDVDDKMFSWEMEVVWFVNTSPSGNSARLKIHAKSENDESCHALLLFSIYMLWRLFKHLFPRLLIDESLMIANVHIYYLNFHRNYYVVVYVYRLF